jgi:hypothetical protein
MLSRFYSGSMNFNGMRMRKTDYSLKNSFRFWKNNKIWYLVYDIGTFDIPYDEFSSKQKARILQSELIRSFRQKNPNRWKIKTHPRFVEFTFDENDICTKCKIKKI